MTPRGCSKLQPTASSRTCTRAAPTPGAPAADTQTVHQILYLLGHPPHTLHTPAASSPHWSFPVLAIPLVRQPLLLFIPLQSWSTWAASPSLWENPRFAETIIWRKKGKGKHEKKKEQFAKKRIMNQKIQQPCFKSEQVCFQRLHPTVNRPFVRLGASCSNPHGIHGHRQAGTQRIHTHILGKTPQLFSPSPLSSSSGGNR